MNAFRPRTLLAFFGLLALAVSVYGRVPADGPPPPTASNSVAPASLAKRLERVTDVVLDHHIDPPPRQQMLLEGLKSLYRTTKRPVPSGLSRRVSSATTTAQFAALLEEAWPQALPSGQTPAQVEERFFEAIFGGVLGGAEVISAKERKVSEQVAGNRYVGIQIAISWDASTNLAGISEAFEDGPADRAGAQRGDLIEEIDGVSTKGLDMRQIIDRLRGEANTDVTVVVRQPNSKERRSLKMTRVAMPRTTVQGFRKTPSKGWDVRLSAPDAIGYLRVTGIFGSTPHELRMLARQLENEGCRALILDLRGSASRLDFDSVHPAVLLADSLLDHGTIGRVQTAVREVTYEADSETILAGWPIAVLVDEITGGTVKWLAAALKDNGRAIVIASSAPRSLGNPDAYVRSTVLIGDGESALTLVTGYLKRGDGSPLGPLSNPIDKLRAVVFPRLGSPGAKKVEGLAADYNVGRATNSTDIMKDEAVKKAIELLRAKDKKVQTDRPQESHAG